MSEPQRLDTQIQIKAVDTAQRLIDGYAAAIGNKDRSGDIIDAGAFDRTLKANEDVLVFIGHDATRLPVGEPVSMHTDTKGLLTQTRVYNTPAGDELLEVAKQRMKSGRTLGMSIGYRVVKARPGGGAMHLQDVDLVEYSFLASPRLAANPEAVMTGVKGRAKGFGGTSTLEASYEDLQGDLREAARATLPGFYVTVCSTYPDHVIVRCEPGYGADGPMSPASTESTEESQFWDYPYTLGVDGEPVLGTPVPVQPAFVPGAAKADDEPKPKESPVKLLTAEIKAALPDTAFAFIAPGGTKDDGGLTIPRASRHFAHHNDDGSLNVEALKDAIADAQASPHGAEALAHLTRHAIKADMDFWPHDSTDDAHTPQWSQGAAPTLMVAAAKMVGLAEDIAADRLAMERLGLDTKDGGRLNPAMRTRLKALHDELGHTLDWADSIERGEDGRLRVEMFRAKLAMLQLEEVS